MPEDTPILDVLNLTRVRYTDAINFLERQTPPLFLKCEYQIDDCNLNDLKSLANEIGFELIEDLDFRIAYIEIKRATYTLTLYSYL